MLEPASSRPQACIVKALVRSKAPAYLFRGFLLAIWIGLWSGRHAIASASPEGLAKVEPHTFVLVGVDGSGVLLTNQIQRRGEQVQPVAPPNKYVPRPLKPLDELHTPTDSRAILDSSDVRLTLDVDSQLEITQPEHFPALFLLAGRLYYRSAGVEISLQVLTRYTRADIRGTEFQMHVDPKTSRTTLDLFDGTVVLTSTDPEGREYGTVTNEVRASQAPEVQQTRVDPRSEPVVSSLPARTQRIQWALYYPGVLDVSELPTRLEEKNELRESLAAYRRGSLPLALAAFPFRAPEHLPRDPSERLYWAALLMSIGQVERATNLLATLKESPANGPGDRIQRLAAALTQVIAAVTGESYQHPERPLLPQEWLATECLAESYYQQLKNDADEGEDLPWDSPFFGKERSRLNRALVAARHAVTNSPGFGFAWARVAELEFTFGNIRRANQALDRVLGGTDPLSPHNAQAITLHGFLAAAELHWETAISDFETAISLDPALGNAWLGRGLMAFRKGRTADEALAYLQSAVSREPQRSLLRSYLGKGYFEIARLRPSRTILDEINGWFGQSNQTGRLIAKATNELGWAHQLDPGDPTPLLYRALIEHHANQVNSAIQSLERSFELSQNRALFRSELLLDQDEAVRGANLAAIYRDAGLAEWSVSEAARAVNRDYGNFFAHLFLANSYDQLRDPRQINLRYETPWWNELLLAQLLAPVGASSLSSLVSQQEYSSLFDRDKARLTSITSYRSTGEWEQAASQYGNTGDFGWAVDVFYRSGDNDVPNTDYDQLTLSTQAKWQLSYRDSLWFQLLYYDTDFGDTSQRYDPADVSPTQRATEEQAPNLFAGFHRQWSPGSHTLFLTGRLHNRFRRTDPASGALYFERGADGSVEAFHQLPFSTNGMALEGAPYNPDEANPVFESFYNSELEAYSAELNQIWQTPRQTLIAGARYQAGTLDTANSIHRPPLANFTISTNYSTSEDLDRVSAYLYDRFEVTDRLSFTAGLSYDRVRIPDNADIVPINRGDHTEDQLSPKLGVEWSLGRRAHLRAAYSRSLGGFYYDSSFRLEPSQIAGFNQAFRSLIPESVVGVVPGSSFDMAGIGGDFKLGMRSYLSLDARWLQSDGSREFGTVKQRSGRFMEPSSLLETLDYDEKTLGINLTHLMDRTWSFSVGYRLLESTLDRQFPGVPPGANVIPIDDVIYHFDPSPRSKIESLLHQIRLSALFNHSTGIYSQAELTWHSQANSGYPSWVQDDDFWQVNLLFGYRFPGRAAELRIALLNLTDEDYRLTPLTLHPDLPRNRTIELSLRFSL